MGLLARYLFSSIIAVLLLSACTSSNVKVALNASESLNPDANHQSLPVVARIYQLKDKQQFESANFNTLWKDDNQYLSKDLLSKEEILIYPGDKKTISLLRQEGAEYIGIVALFRDYKEGTWRTLVPAKRKVKLEASENKIKVAG